MDFAASGLCPGPVVLRKRAGLTFSRSLRPIESKWESVLTEWGTKDRDDLYGTTAFPFVTLEGDKRISQKTFFDTRDIKELGAGGVFIQASAIDNTRVDNGDAYRQIEHGLHKLSTPTQAKVCARIREKAPADIREGFLVSVLYPLQIIR